MQATTKKGKSTMKATRDQWTAERDPEKRSRMNAGRKRINGQRKFAREHRMTLAVSMLAEFGLRHGSGAAIARRLGVHRATVSKYFAAMRREIRRARSGN